jgi:spore coat polysaccharide biosynthesis protein SpsF (cytidylyltransferase family)
MATVFLQARMGSSRLPGKAMMVIERKPMLYYAITALQNSSVVKRLAVLTSVNSMDDGIADFAKGMGVECFRGSEDNVLERFYQAMQVFRDDVYFRATGDNPILDSENPNRTLAALRKTKSDYACEADMPIGTVVEAITAQALQRCYEMAHQKEDLEHVTLFVKRSLLFRSHFFKAPLAYQFPKLRLTVDYHEDFLRVEMIINELYKKGIPDFLSVIGFCQKQGWV